MASKILALCLSRQHMHHQTHHLRCTGFKTDVKVKSLKLKHFVALQCSHSLEVVFVLWLKEILSAWYPYEDFSCCSVLTITILKTAACEYQ